MDILPIATASSEQTIYVTTTGVEKIFVLIGIATVVILSLIGLITIVSKFIRSWLNGRKKA